jgi:deferrochelatase/peroxidase EfeB
MTFQNQQLAPVEPELDADEIQGNAIPGFMKPHMALLFLRITDVDSARTYLADISGRVTTLRQVWPSRKAVRAARSLEPTRKSLAATPKKITADVWLNVAVSYRALADKLDTGELNLAAFEDPAFRAGMRTRSPDLGDPIDPDAAGHPDNWVVGGPGNEPDLVLIVAADSPKKLDTRVKQERRISEQHQLYVVHEDHGHKLDETDTGKEHFGFQDGISQPGVRGLIGDEFLAHRCIDEKQVPDRYLYGLPGQLLVWPGEFVFGYPAASADPLVPGAVAQPGPQWSRNGSYLVYRRLRQDVQAFEDFIAQQATHLREQSGFANWTDDRLAAALVGRWKSGAPVIRTPAKDDEELGRNRLYNNSFGYAREPEHCDSRTAGRRLVAGRKPQPTRSAWCARWPRISARSTLAKPPTTWVPPAPDWIAESYATASPTGAVS